MNNRFNNLICMVLLAGLLYSVFINSNIFKKESKISGGNIVETLTAINNMADPSDNLNSMTSEQLITLRDQVNGMTSEEI